MTDCNYKTVKSSLWPFLCMLYPLKMVKKVHAKLRQMYTYLTGIMCIYSCSESLAEAINPNSSVCLFERRDFRYLKS